MNLQFRGWRFGSPSAFLRSEGKTGMRLLADFFFLILFFVLIVGWLCAWALYHVAGGAIHLLLIVAVISLIVHFFRGRSAV